MRHSISPALLAALALSAPAAAAGTPVVLLSATGANVSEGELSAATDVLRGHLEGTGRFSVALAGTPGGLTPEPSPSQAGDAARAARAELAVTLRVSRLGSAGTVRLAAYGPDGALVHADQLGASGPDDLDPALRRLAKGLADAGAARDLAEIDTVTAREAVPHLKRTATHVFGLRLGGAYLMGRAGSDETTRISGGGVFWLYDARSFLADVSLDFAGGEGDHLFQIGLGAYYPFSRSSVSPYLGGGVSYGWIDTGGDGRAGLALRGAAGLLVGRLSTVQIRVEGGWMVAGFAVQGRGEDQVPNGPFLSIGLGL